MGRRRLAYPIKRQTEAHYLLTTYELDPERASELEADLVLAQEVLKHMVVKLDDEEFQKAAEEPPAPVVAETAPEPAEPVVATEAPVAEASAPATAEAPAAEASEPAAAEAPEPVEASAPEPAAAETAEPAEAEVEEGGEESGGEESGSETAENKEGT